VLDIATTVVSYGTVKNYRLQGKEMPAGWMVNKKDGEPLTDPARSAEGLLNPIGGHKGSGLALVLGLLAGPLNRAAFGRDVLDFNYDDETPCNTGHFIIALDVARFTPLETFRAEVDRHLHDLRTSQPLPSFDAIRLPGTERRRRRVDRLRNGVPMLRELIAQLDQLADELGVKRLGER
jgi:LDH2 family malate/lactate/ureidoglycolate dehydrogenase